MTESRDDLESTGEQALPIFLDTTGRRRRWLRWLGYGVGALCAGYPIVLVVSLTGGPVRPDTLASELPKPTTSRPGARGAPLLIGTVPSADRSRAAAALPSPPGATRRRPQAARSGPPRTPLAAMPSPKAAPSASPSSTPSDGATPTPGFSAAPGTVDQ